MGTIILTSPEKRAVKHRKDKLARAIGLYLLGEVSLEKAAELSGYSLNAFVEILDAQQVAIIDYPEKEIIQDRKNLK